MARAVGIGGQESDPVLSDGSDDRLRERGRLVGFIPQAGPCGTAAEGALQST